MIYPDIELYMISESDFDSEKFPNSESDKYEYKQSINDKIFSKYLETICGFLNTCGGYLIFGIKDNLDLIGLKIKQKELDNFILRIDSILGSGQIIGIDSKSGEFVKLQSSNIKINQITNKDGKKFLMIEVVPEANIKYQLANGLIYYRLGASNYFEKKERIFKQSDFENACKNIQTKAEEDNKSNIKLFQKTLDDKNKQINELNNKLKEEKETNDIYQNHLEKSLNNQNKIINYNSNQNIILTNIFKSIFPCFKG
jgi:predicted HTH transcriptional regulator